MAQFKDLFSIRVTHSFYPAGCPDVAFVTPSDTAAAMKGGRVRTAMVDGQLRVLYQADDAGRAELSLAGKTLRFGLKSTNTYLGNITKSAIPSSAVALYRNAKDPRKLNAAVAAVPAYGLTTVSLAKGRPVTVRVLADGGATLRESTVAPAATKTATLDFGGLGPGVYMVEESYPKGVVVRTPYLFDPAVLREGLFGVVQIRIQPGFYSSPPVFEIPLDAREETLRYYLVVQGYSPAELANLNVVDAGFSAASRPEIKFDRVPSSSFTASELPADVLGAGGASVVAFRSKTPVARKAGGRQRIQLSNNGEVLIANLPQPGPNQPSADLVVHLSKKA